MDKKSFYIAILWTVIAIVVVLYLFVSRSVRMKSVQTVPPRVRVSPAVSPRNKRTIPKSVLITLNEVFVSSDPSMVLLGSLDSLRELSSKVADMYLVYTIPIELAGKEDVPESVQKCLDELIENARLVGFKKHRLLFTNTREGRISVARQLQAELTMDPDADLVDQLQGKVPSVVCMATNSDFTNHFRKFFAS